MSIFISTIHKCPIASRSRGLIEIEPWILMELAGAVLDSHEWLTILLGSKSNGGLYIKVDNFYTPPDQKRDRTTCSTEEDLPDHIIPQVVGVLHSHNTMGARFSGTDLGPEGLNSTFPMSIVISTFYTESNEEATLLGFDYEAQLNFDLPCGSLGVCEARIIPSGVTDWPHPSSVHLAPSNITIDNLEDCDQWKASNDSTPYKLRRIGKCGASESKLHIRNCVFGSDGETILSELPKPWAPPLQVKGYGSYSPSIPRRWEEKIETSEELYGKYEPDTFDYLAQYYAERYGLDDEELDDLKEALK